MPTYQYACTECGHQLEAVQSFTDDPLTECPACTGQLRKVFNSVGIVFKGSGFYRTDSRSGGSDTTANSTPTKSESSNGSKSADSTSSGGSTSSATTSGSASGGSSGSSGSTNASAASSSAKTPASSPAKSS